MTRTLRTRIRRREIGKACQRVDQVPRPASRGEGGAQRRVRGATRQEWDEWRPPPPPPAPFPPPRGGGAARPAPPPPGPPGLFLGVFFFPRKLKNKVGKEKEKKKKKTCPKTTPF